jgi:hypothetical protein
VNLEDRQNERTSDSDGDCLLPLGLKEWCNLVGPTDNPLCISCPKQKNSTILDLEFLILLLRERILKQNF